MEDTRLDLDAPLLSARRFSTVHPPAASSSSCPFSPRRQSPSRTALPAYNPGQKSGPVRIPGSAPFLWEHSPGRPKPSPTGSGPTPVQHPPVRPPPRTAHGVRTARRPVDGPEHAEASHADAREALSRADSLLANCSLGGIADYADHPRALYADAPACDFIMGRFLPAAQALAGGGPRPQSCEIVENASACEREPVKPSPVGRMVVPRRAPILCPHSTNYADDEEEEEEVEYYYDHSSRDFSTNKVCGLIPIFCLNNSFCLLKLRGRSSRRDEYENALEADYKRKLEQRNQEGRIQLNTESNWIMDWTSSQMADWAFPFPHSTFGEAPALEFHEVQGSSNPAFQKTLSVDLKERSVNRVSETVSTTNCTAAGKDHKVEGNLTAESRGSNALQHKSSGAADPRLQIFPNNENAEHDISEDSTALPRKLQLLLPKSPSDSWLSRVLPSVSSKKLPTQSFLVLRSPPKKQASRALLDPKPDLYGFAEVCVCQSVDCVRDQGETLVNSHLV